MDLASISKEYFSNLNALAEKITADIENTQEAYQDLWHSLSKNEQNQAIDESIISPSAVLKYSSLPIKILKQNYNAYSWFTKSQLNLYKLELMGYPDSENVICRSDADQVSKMPISKAKEPKHDSVNTNSNKNKTSLFSSKNTEEKASKAQSTSHKNTVLKPKTPPPPPPPKMSVPPVVHDAINEESDDMSNNDIPKTGFDFLDNW